MELISNNSKKIGRNDLCPCGSGKKHKKCCLNIHDYSQLSAERDATLNPGLIRHGMETTLKRIAKIAGSSDLSPEDLNRFFAGRDLDDIDAEFARLPSGPKDQAEELLSRAFEERNHARVVKLAKEALELYPHLADAWILIGENVARSPQEILPYFEKALEAGGQDLGEEFVRQNEGHFWGMVETRPFMRAKAHLGQVLWDLGREGEAIDQFQGCLKLNPNDNQGIRYQLLGCLLANDRLSDAEQIFKKYKRDGGALWAFSKALYCYKLHGPESKKTSKQLVAAIVENPHIPKYLSGKKKPPAELPEGYTLGSIEEAVIYAEESKIAWQRTPGALEWLSHFS